MHANNYYNVGIYRVSLLYLVLVDNHNLFVFFLSPPLSNIYKGIVILNESEVMILYYLLILIHLVFVYS